MTKHRARRFFLIWTPAYLAGVAMIVASATLTDATNGLTVLGTITAVIGLGAAAHDNSTRSTR